MIARRVQTLPRVPLKGYLDLTYRCNNDCLHCWLKEPETEAGRRTELSSAEWMDIIDQSRALGTREWAVSGGEPLLRSDFAGILSHLKRKSAFLTVFTNGTRLTSFSPELWRGCDLEVSLYGATAQAHDGVTRNPGSYEETLEGIRFLQRNGVPFAIRAFPLKANFHEWPRMLELAARLSRTVRIGAAWLHLSAAGDPVKNEEIRSQRLTPGQVLDVDPPNVSWEENRLEKSACGAPLHDGRLFEKCIAFRNEFHVDARGGMSFCLCVKDPDLRYDLRKGSVREAWESFIPAICDRVRGDQDYLESCGACADRSFCRWCSVFSHLEHRRPDRPVAYLCDVAREHRQYHERWKRDHRRFFEIAGISIQVDSDRPFGDQSFSPQLRSFQRPAAGADLVRLEHHEGIPVMDGQFTGTVVHDRAPWRVYRKDSGWLYFCYSNTFDEQHWVHVTAFSRDHSHARVFRNPEFPSAAAGGNSLTGFPTDQLWISQLLALRQGFYLHSSGMVMSGRGLLFVGHSEAGKSTITRMLNPAATVLCDDRIIVRRRNREWRVYGTWSHGEIPDVSDADAAVAAVFFLEKSSDNRLVPIGDRMDRRRRLLSCLIRPVATPEWWEATLPLVYDLADSVPCYAMRFDRSGAIVGQIEKRILA